MALCITLGVLAFVIIMFVWQKVPMCVTSMTCCAILAATGILKPAEAFGVLALIYGKALTAPVGNALTDFVTVNAMLAANGTLS